MNVGLDRARIRKLNQSMLDLDVREQNSSIVESNLQAVESPVDVNSCVSW
jgi:hypothetical protein